MPDAETRRIILTIASLSAAGVGAMLALYWAAFLARRPRRFCPGQKRPPSAWLWPFTWVTYPQCGYELPAGAACRCPECGRTSDPRQRRRWTSSFAWNRAAALLLLLGVSPPAWSYLRSGAWAERLPTTALLATRSVFGNWAHVQVRHTLLGRFCPPPDDKGWRGGRSTAPAWQQRWAIRLYIRDLKNDNVRYNAEEAQDALDWFNPQLIIGPLQQALNSDDYQQRQYAALLLRDTEGSPVTDDLIRVSVEALADDPPDERVSWMTRSNAGSAFAYLRRHGDAAANHLKSALASSDAQQRFLAAVLAAATRQEALLPTACPMLIESLGNDNVGENAKFAAAAIVMLGAPALPYLDRACSDPDDQRRQVAFVLAEHIREPRGPAVRLLESDPASITFETTAPSRLRLEALNHNFHDFPRITSGAPATRH